MTNVDNKQDFIKAVVTLQSGYGRFFVFGPD